jgi:hypothetical protein
MKFKPSPFQNSLSKMSSQAPYITDGASTPVVQKKPQASKFEEFTPTPEEDIKPTPKRTTKKKTDE